MGIGIGIGMGISGFGYRTVPLIPGTDYGALAIANGLGVVGWYRGDLGVTGTAGTGKASWAPVAGLMSAITPHGTATNGIGSVTAGLNGKAGLKLDGSTQIGQYTAPVLAAPNATNWHRYWIARQASAGVSGGVRKVFGDAGDVYRLELASATVIYAYGAGPSTPGVTHDVWQRGRVCYTGSTTGEYKQGASLLTGGTGATAAPGTTRQFGSLLLNWEFLLYMELTGPKANFLTFAGLADTAARTVDWTTAVEI